MSGDMKSNNTGKVVAAIVVLVIVFIGGYMLGARSSNGSKSVYAGAGSSAPLAVDRSTVVAELESKLKENPDDTKLLISLADAYFERKQFSKAVANYKRAVQADPGNVDFYNDIGLAMHYMGDSAGALKYIEEGINKNPYKQRIWLTKGFILAYGMGDLDAAKEAWEKTKALDPLSGIGKAAADYLTQVSKR
jgi:tetratricopeptide (TPR) repeat protein